MLAHSGWISTKFPNENKFLSKAWVIWFLESSDCTIHNNKIFWNNFPIAFFHKKKSYRCTIVQSLSSRNSNCPSFHIHGSKTIITNPILKNYWLMRLLTAVHSLKIVICIMYLYNISNLTFVTLNFGIRHRVSWKKSQTNR